MSDVYAPRPSASRVTRPTRRTSAPVNDDLARRQANLARLTTGRSQGTLPPKLAEAAKRAREGRDAAESLMEDLGRVDNSLLGQIGNEVRAAVTQGPAQILKAGFGTTIGPIRAAVDLVKDGELRGDGLYGAFKEYQPLPAMMSDSLENTYRRNIDPLTPWNWEGPGGVVNNWQEASDQNRIAAAIFEDVGNAALIGGTVSKLVGRAPRSIRVANPTDRLVVQGSTEAVPRSLSAGGAADAQLRGTMMTPPRKTQAAIRRAAATGEVADVIPVPAVPRGSGLAGYARRAGRDAVADRLDVVGQNVGRVTRVLDAPDNLTVGMQFMGAGKLAGAAGRAGMKVATRIAPKVNAVLGTADNALNQFVDVDARARRDIAQEFSDALRGDKLAVSRDGAAILRVANEYKLDQPQMSVVLNSLDHRWDDIANAVEALPEEAGRALVLERFADRPERMRPTYEGVRAIIDYRRADPAVNPKVTQAITDVARMVEGMTEERTARLIDDQSLNPEQTGSEMLTPALNTIRGRLETRRNRTVRSRNQRLTKAMRAESVDRAQAAINATIPEPARARDLLEQGRRAGVEQQKIRGLRQDHTQAKIDLGRAVDEYRRAEARDGANSSTVLRLERQLNDLIDETVKLEQQVRTEQRRLDAASGLVPATGEVETVDADGNPIDPQAQIQGEINEIAQRPDPDLSNMTTVKAIETVAKEVIDDIKYDLYGQLDRLTGGAKLLTRDFDGNTYDWYDSLSTTEKQVYARDGWLRNEQPSGRSDPGAPDGIAEQMTLALGRPISEGQAVQMYLDLIGQINELRARGGQNRQRREKLKGFEIDEATGEIRQRYAAPRRVTSAEVPARVIDAVAERMNMSPEVVSAALNGNATRLRDALADDVRRGYDEVKAAWDSIEPEMKASIYETAREIAEEGGDLFEYIMDVAENYGLDARDTMSMYGTTDASALWMWLEGADPVVPDVFVRAVTETPGPTQRRLIKRMQDSLKSTKAALRRRYSEQRSLRRIVDSVRDDADARVEDAAGRVDVAEIQMDASQARLQAHMETRPRLDETASTTPRSLDGWKRRRIVDPVTGEVREYTSRYEQDRVREGRASTVARAEAKTHAGTLRQGQKWNDRIAGLRTEMGRSVQLRLAEDVNAPAVRRYFKTVRSEGKALGNVIPALGDVPAQLTGLMDRVAQSQVGREGSFRIAALMEEWGPFESVGARYNAFIDALERLDAVIVKGADGVRTVAEGTDDFRDLRDSMLAERAIETMNQAVAAAGPNNLNLPYRVRDAARRATKGFSEDARNRLEDQFVQYDRQRNRMLRSTWNDYLAVMPKRFREVVRENIADVNTYLDIAERAINDGDTYLADLMHRLAEDAPTTLERLREDGVDPVHLVGGKPVSDSAGVRAAAGSGGIGKTTTRGSRQSRTGGRPETLSDYVKLEMAEQASKISGNTLALIKAHPGLGRRADSVVGEFIERYKAENLGNLPDADAIGRALDEAGWGPLPKEGAVGPQTLVAPKIALKQFEVDSMASRAWPWKALSTGNRLFKYSVLAASPLWQIGNVVGNMFMSTIGLGKMSPLDMPRLFRQAVEQSGGLKAFWRQGGLASWAPDELASHGLAYGEHDLIRRAWDEKGSLDPSLFKKIIDGAYSINEFADNSFRSMMYADQMQKMADNPRFDADGNPVIDLAMSEKAVKHTLRALGDFTNMTAFEKRYVREVFPFYAWIRHQTLMTMRMPIYSPLRTAYLLALTDMMEDEDFANEYYQMVGSSIPIPAIDVPFLGKVDHLNLGNISPFSTPWDLPLPTNLPALSQALSPALKVPVQMVTGFDVGRLRNTTRPYDERPQGPYGSTPPAAPPLRGLAGLGEMAYIAAGALPQTKAARDIALGSGTARYGSGQRVGDGEYDDDTSVLETVLSGARMPRLDSMEDRLYDLTQQMLKRQG